MLKNERVFAISVTHPNQWEGHISLLCKSFARIIILLVILVLAVLKQYQKQDDLQKGCIFHIFILSDDLTCLFFSKLFQELDVLQMGRTFQISFSSCSVFIMIICQYSTNLFLRCPWEHGHQYPGALTLHLFTSFCLVGFLQFPVSDWYQICMTSVWCRFCIAGSACNCLRNQPCPQW